MKTCPCPCGCRASANTLEEKERIFGWRGKIIQSYCRKCRVPHPHKQNQTTEKQNQTNEHFPPIFEFILKGINFDFQNTDLPKPPRFVNGVRYTKKDQNDWRLRYLIEKNEPFIRYFLQLISEKEPSIEEEKFLKLFKIYNFHTKKPDKESFFNFVISLDTKEINLDQKLNSNKQIYVILKIYTVITEAYLKVLSEKLGNSSAIVISFVNDITQDFIKNNDQICVFDRDLIQFLLEIRNDKIKFFDVFNLENST